MPNVTIRIPMPLRSFIGGRAEVQVEASTADEALEKLVGENRSLRAHLYSDDGELRRFVNVFVGERDLRTLDDRERRLDEGSEIRIVPSIAGGSAVAPRLGDPAATSAGTAGREREVELGRSELLRYSRHLMIPEVGLEGQKRLKGSSVMLVGAGGLGSPLALYLAAAGVGRIGLVDHDTVDFTNLQRQVLHDTASVGTPKLASARARLEGLNPEIEVITIEQRLDSSNALEVLEGWDVVADGSDNFPTRYLVNDACVLLGIPCVWGAIYRFEGQASVFGVEGGPCYRCLFRDPPPPGLVPSCADAGVLGVLPGIVGTIQATEVVKLLLGAGRTLAGRLLVIDALRMEFRELEVRRDPECPVCGDEPEIRELIDYERFCGIEAGAAEGPQVPEIDVLELKRRLESGEAVQVLDVREEYEWAICNLEEAGARLIPLDQLPARTGELDRVTPLVVHCRSGVRSARAVELLRDAGFDHAVNLRGGILAWAREVDPSLPMY